MVWSDGARDPTFRLYPTQALDGAVLPDARWNWRAPEDAMTTPLSPSTVRDLFAHNYWARDGQLEACAGLTVEQFLEERVSGFSGVKPPQVDFLVWCDAVGS
jgi:hypothetical protein